MSNFTGISCGISPDTYDADQCWKSSFFKWSLIKWMLIVQFHREFLWSQCARMCNAKFPPSHYRWMQFGECNRRLMQFGEYNYVYWCNLVNVIPQIRPTAMLQWADVAFKQLVKLGHAAKSISNPISLYDSRMLIIIIIMIINYDDDGRQYKPRFECMEQCYASYTALSPHHSLARYCIQVR